MKLPAVLANVATGVRNFLAPAASGDSTAIYRQAAIWPIYQWLAGIPDPDEVLLRTGRTRRNLAELLRDAEISQALDTRREAVISTPWHMEIATSRATKFITDELAPVMNTIVSAAWDAVPYGYSVIEVVYARKGPRIGIGAVCQPPFYWFRPLPDGGLLWFPASGVGSGQGELVGKPKFFLTARNADYANPYGQALLSALYWPVTWRLQGWQLWLDFLQTFGAPIVVGKTASYNKFIEAMQAQGVKQVVAWQPQGDKEEITTITASTAGEFERLHEALNKTIQKAVLGQTLTSDVGATGSYAAAKVHNDVRDDKRRADLRLVTDTVQDIVDALWQLNAFPGDPPAFDMQDDVGLEIERANRDAILASIGVQFTANYFEDNYDLETADFTLAAPAPAQGLGPDGQPLPTMTPKAKETPPVDVSATAALLGPKRFTPQQMVIERGIAAMVAKAKSPLSPAELKSAIIGAKNQLDLEERLAVLLDQQDPAYAELLARAQFVAAVIGYAHAGA